MQFGICPSPFPWWTRIEQLGEWAAEAERLGYHAIFLPDHYNLPVPPFPSNELLDAWVTFSYIAAKTTSIKVGSNVSPIPRWVPSQLAKVITTVDILSNGRVIAGFGAGVFPQEFTSYAPGGCWDEPRIRVEKFLEGLRLIIKLWTEDKVTFKGKYYTVTDAVLLPKPVQKPHPPLWSGGLGPYMLKMTARYFDGWVPHRGTPEATPTPEDYEPRVRMIQGYAKEYGRDMSKFTFGLLGNINDSAEIIEKYREAGCQYYIPELIPPPPADQYVELTRKFAKEIIPSFR